MPVKSNSPVEAKSTMSSIFRPVFSSLYYAKSASSKMTGPKAKKSDTKRARKSQGETTKAVNTLRI